jgi:glycerol-3-phosphate cytidylyltransferase
MPKQDVYKAVDELKELCEVVYLPRTAGISTTKIKEDLEKLGRNV